MEKHHDTADYDKEENKLHKNPCSPDCYTAEPVRPRSICGTPNSGTSKQYPSSSNQCSSDSEDYCVSHGQHANDRKQYPNTSNLCLNSNTQYHSNNHMNYNDSLVGSETDSATGMLGLLDAKEYRYSPHSFLTNPVQSSYSTRTKAQGIKEQSEDSNNNLKSESITEFYSNQVGVGQISPPTSSSYSHSSTIGRSPYNSSTCRRARHSNEAGRIEIKREQEEPSGDIYYSKEKYDYSYLHRSKECKIMFKKKFSTRQEVE